MAVLAPDDQVQGLLSLLQPARKHVYKLLKLRYFLVSYSLQQMVVFPLDAQVQGLLFRLQPARKHVYKLLKLGYFLVSYR
jgi:hypothetical protein